MSSPVKTNLSLIPKNAKQINIQGEVGVLDCLLFEPTTDIVGISVVFHPDPTGGGTYNNKVVQTLAKTLSSFGYRCICPNLRGVNASEGVCDIYDNNIINDGLSAISYLQHITPDKTNLIIAGFSFGASIAAKIATQIQFNKLILVAPAITRFEVPITNNKKTFTVHGRNDELIPIADIQSWAHQYQLQLETLDNNGHFFHGKLSALQDILSKFIAMP